MPENDLCKRIKDEVKIVDYAQRIGFTPVKKGRWYSTKEHDSVMIDPEKNTYTRFSDKTGGSVIDFAMRFGNLTQDQAIRNLREQIITDTSPKQGKPSVTISPKTQEKEIKGKPEKKRQVLDISTPNIKGNEKAYDYLCNKRGIDTEIVTDMINRDMLYESAKYHNVCFLGRDYDGNIKYGFNRSTGETKFAGDMAGSQKKIGIYIDNGSKSLVIGEAIIDLMSVMTITKMNGGDYKSHNYLSFQGQNLGSVVYHMSRPENSHITQIVTSMDNDPAGNRYREKIREVLADTGYEGKIYDRTPQSKDYNDDLLERLNINKKKETEVEIS